MGPVFGSGRPRDAFRMTARASLWSRLRAALRRDALEAELADELDFHLEMQARKHRAAGLDEAEARARARLEFGNLELAKEDARDVRGARPLEDFIADARYAVRGLYRAPVFSLSVILTISLAVGLNTSAFTIFDAYVLRPFEIRDPYSLYSLQWLDRSGHVREFSPGEFDQLRTAAAGRGDLAAYRTFTARIGAGQVTGDAVSENYFQMTGVRAALGRTLTSADRYTPVVILSDGVWRGRFDADSDIIGKPIAIRGVAFRIIGVAQQGFAGFFKKPRDFWMPIDAQSGGDSVRGVATARGEQLVSVLARLAPGVSASQGRAFFESRLETMTAALPDSARSVRVFLTSRATAISPSIGAFLAFAPLMLAFGLILALACANIASLLLARGVARRREIGTRLALGAERMRLIRQLVTEALVLALPAVAVGFALAEAAVGLGVRALFATLPPDLATFVRLVPLHPDARVLGFALLASIAAALLSGVVPALRTTELSLADAIRGNFGGASAGRPRTMLVIGQIAASSLLLTLAGVIVREAARLGRTDTGLETRDVVSVELHEKARLTLLAALRTSAHVDTLAAAAALPLDMRFPTAVVQSGDSGRTTVLYNRVSAGYFNVLGIRILAGRGFTRQEDANASPAVIVSQAAARRLWPGASPLGRVIRFETKSGDADPVARYQNATVIGVARDVVVGSVAEGNDRPVLYLPQSLEAAGCCILARVRGQPVVAKRALDEELEKAVPGGVERIDLLNTFVAGAVYPYRAAYWVALGLGAVALGLTLIGVYGVVGYAVNQRVREIGVRMALGARPADVVRLIVSHSLKQAAAGAAVGSLLALGGARLVAANVQGMPAFDALAFASAFGAVVSACLVAALIPSRRAATLDPTTALRQD